MMHRTPREGGREGKKRLLCGTVEGREERGGLSWSQKQSGRGGGGGGGGVVLYKRRHENNGWEIWDNKVRYKGNKKRESYPNSFSSSSPPPVSPSLPSNSSRQLFHLFHFGYSVGNGRGRRRWGKKWERKWAVTFLDVFQFREKII